MEGFKTKVISITNQKGGVGKTTTTANVAYALSQMGRDVLCIDFDSQASLTNYLNVGIAEENYYGIFELMVRQFRGEILPEEDEVLSKMSFEEMIEACICRPTYTERKVQVVDGKKKLVPNQVEFGFDLLPSSLDLSDFELEISGVSMNGQSNAFHLIRLIHKILQVHEYDYVLIDCNPSLGVMAVNAITAAVDGILIPTNLDLMSTRGVRTLINKIADIQEVLLKAGLQHMGVIGVILNLYSERRSVDKAIQNDMERFYPFRIFENAIPESINAKKALFAGVIYSQIYKKAEEAYKALAKEIEAQLSVMEEDGMQIRRLEDGFAMSDRIDEEENDEQ